jgi:hypothetical protein
VDDVYDGLAKAIRSGKLDPFLDELGEVVEKRAFMLKNLPKQVSIGKPVIAQRPRPAKGA